MDDQRTNRASDGNSVMSILFFIPAFLMALVATGQFLSGKTLNASLFAVTSALFLFAGIRMWQRSSKEK